MNLKLCPLFLFCFSMMLLLGCVDSGLANKAVGSMHAEANAVATVEKEKENSIPSLNAYNSYWDGFSGALEVGKAYEYRNRGVNRNLHYSVVQVWTENKVLVGRHWAMDYADGVFQIVCEESVFLVVSKRSYADGATLCDGWYLCTGTQTYEARDKTTKTVYVLEEQDRCRDMSH